MDWRREKQAKCNAEDRIKQAAWHLVNQKRAHDRARQACCRKERAGPIIDSAHSHVGNRAGVGAEKHDRQRNGRDRCGRFARQENQQHWHQDRPAAGSNECPIRSHKQSQRSEADELLKFRRHVANALDLEVVWSGTASTQVGFARSLISRRPPHLTTSRYITPAPGSRTAIEINTVSRTEAVSHCLERTIRRRRGRIPVERNYHSAW